MEFSIIGTGGVGEVITRHLVRASGCVVRVGDLDPSRVKEIAKISPLIHARKLDASNADKVARFIDGSDVVINASNPRFNALIMKQALRKRVHYVDLAGENSASVEQQLGEDNRWKKAQRLAVLGMGEDPGLSNIMARHATDLFDTVEKVRIRDGETSTSGAYPFVALFAPSVFLEEAVSPAQYFEHGELKRAPPMSGKEVYTFPEPIGAVTVYGMDHEEVHSLPRFLPKKPNFVDFKLALTDGTASSIRLFYDLGFLSRKPIKVGNGKVAPLNFLLALLPKPSEIAGKIQGNAGVLVEAKGKKGGQGQTVRTYSMMSHKTAHEKHQTNATSYLTGTSTVICALMLADNRIPNKGVVPPECLDPNAFLKETEKFGLEVHTEVSETDDASN